MQHKPWMSAYTLQEVKERKKRKRCSTPVPMGHQKLQHMKSTLRQNREAQSSLRTDKRNFNEILVGQVFERNMKEPYNTTNRLAGRHKQANKMFDETLPLQLITAKRDYQH